MSHVSTSALLSELHRLQQRPAQPNGQLASFRDGWVSFGGCGQLPLKLNNPAIPHHLTRASMDNRKSRGKHSFRVIQDTIRTLMQASTPEDMASNRSRPSGKETQNEVMKRVRFGEGKTASQIPRAWEHPLDCFVCRRWWELYTPNMLYFGGVPSERPRWGCTLEEVYTPQQPGLSRQG